MEEELIAFLERMYAALRDKVDEAILEGNPKALAEHTYRLQGFETAVDSVKDFLAPTGGN